MKVQLKELFDIIGEVKTFDYAVDESELIDYPSYSFSTPIAVKGSIENRAGVVTLRYTVDFSMNLVCDRCLKDFTREYSYDFNHILVRNSNMDNDEYVVCQNNVLDLNELAISDLLLQLPTKILCREDCKGLCYVCGHDLNEGECSCS